MLAQYTIFDGFITVIAVALVIGVLLHFWFTRNVCETALKFLDHDAMDAVIAIVLLAVLYHVFPPKDDESVVDFSMLLAVIAAFGIQILSVSLKRLLTNRLEDRSKLTDNYRKLISKYASIRKVSDEEAKERECHKYWISNERMIAGDGKWISHRIPNSGDVNDSRKDKLKNALKHLFTKCTNDDVTVEHFPVLVDYYLNHASIHIHDDGSKEYALPEFIKDNYAEIFQAHDTSNIYNQTNIRVDDWYVKDEELHICTSRTSFYNSMLTNRVMDYGMQSGMSVREALQYGPYVPSLKDSRLSNHIGFNGIVESADGWIPLVKRNRYVSIGKNTIGTSVSASMKTIYVVSEADGEVTKAGMENAMIREICDELKIPADKIEPISFENNVIAAYRDVVEGNKPQLLLYVKVGSTRDEIETAFEKAIKEKKKKRRLLSKEHKEREDGNQLYWISREDFLLTERCNISMDGRKVHTGSNQHRLHIFEDYVSGYFNIKVSNRYKQKHKHKKIVPSAAVSLLLVAKYLRETGR